MADLLSVSGGVKTQGNLPETWTAPASLFDTVDRNDGSVYGWAAATSTLTLPSTGLADGYLIVGAFEYEDTSNGRFNPQGKFVQTVGTGNFVGSPTGGYNRDTSEDRSYVRCWAFIDSPSASAQIQFQWKADTDDATGGTVRSHLQVIPLYYSNIGMYTSTSAALYGGTTPNQVTGFTATHESDTAAIEIASNVVSMKGDNKRYLCLGSQFFEGRGGRTQRWHGFRINGTKYDEAKAYSMYRSTANDESGDLFTYMLETVTATVTIDQFCYRGDGVASGQGGADIDGSTPTVGDHSMVIIELNDSAEVFRVSGSTNQNIATTAPVDIQTFATGDIDTEDTDSFTRSSDTAMNAEVAMDALLGANISAASQAITSGQRFTGFAEFTVNGVEDPDTVSGDYLRGNQSTMDCFGWSANLLSALALALNDDIGVSCSELSGSEGHGGAVHIQAGWVGMWGINLDTMEQTGGTSTESITKSLSYEILTTASVTKNMQYDITRTVYSREAAASLPTNANDLSTLYTETEKTNVATDNGVYVDLSGTDYLMHLYRYKHTNDQDLITPTWNGQVSKAPSEATVYLQIYNFNSGSWETLDSDNTTAVDTDFDLTGTIDTNQSNYYDADNFVAVRVYQQS